MTGRIFRSICAAALAVLLVTIVLIYGVLFNYFSGVQKMELRTELTLAAQGVEKLGASYFSGLSTEDYRVTWIDPQGTVLYDSKSDSAEMENHLEREEIQDALRTGSGESSRYSDTMMVRSLYCARKLDDGTVLRMSTAQSSVLSLLLGMAQPILLVVAAALVFSFVLAGRLSKRIVKPLNQLNLDAPLENEEYDELAPLLRRIHSQQQQIGQKETYLRQKQRELDTIIGNMAEGMILLDMDGKILSMNHAAKRYLQTDYTSGDFLVVCRDLEVQKAVAEAKTGKVCTVQTELNGRFLRISAAPVMEGERSFATAVVLFDITQQEQAEQRRREFTANVSHELKTPLHAISGYSELLKCGMVQQADIKPFAERIYHESQRLETLVEDIINLSHLDEGANDLQWSQQDLYTVAEQTVESLQSVAQEQGVRLSLEGCHTEIRGIGDLLHSMLYNLCDNAIKYNRRGGSVTVTVSPKCVCVKDTGIGIPQEHLDRIFERFYRVDKSHSKEVGGTGLGLSIVKHAALIHQAKISVESTVGVGTAITVRFPA